MLHWRAQDHIRNSTPAPPDPDNLEQRPGGPNAPLLYVKESELKLYLESTPLMMHVDGMVRPLSDGAFRVAGVFPKAWCV